MLHIENVGHYSIVKANGDEIYPISKIAPGYGALAYSRIGNATFGKTGFADIANALDYARRLTEANPDSTLVPYFK